MPNNFDEGAGVVVNTIHLILLIDNSYSMKGSRIAQVNNAIPTLKRVLTKIEDDEEVNIMLRVVAFSDEAVWKVGSPEQGVSVADFKWEDLGVVGGTRTDLAVKAAASALHTKNLTTQENAKILRPVVILLTDGYCNPSNHADYLMAIEELKKCLAGDSGKDKSTRVAIGVEDFQESELVEFASLGQFKDAGQQEPPKPLVFPVHNVEDLGTLIQWIIPTSIIASIKPDENAPDVPIIPDPSIEIL